ncbi:hypothetical protein PR048_009685 [Dryococelus australis]|uniref:DNA helicase Pif1-like 2B domain-containing protein n=1 Tax=Dryococelus australis TaxID=614101 RepID=A0ABQ9I0M9_9NEOP|nr:hypothetical protein PR048_009685 [Dryococelus australis]
MTSDIWKDLQGEIAEYLSVDNEQSNAYTVEFLNYLQLSSVSSHKFKLISGIPIMLMVNLDALRLCNATRINCYPPTKVNRVQTPAGSLRIFASENRPLRFRWSAGFLGDIPFHPPLYSGDAPCSAHFTPFGSGGLNAKSCPILFTYSLTLPSLLGACRLVRPLKHMQETLTLSGDRHDVENGTKQRVRRRPGQLVHQRSDTELLRHSSPDVKRAQQYCQQSQEDRRSSDVHVFMPAINTSVTEETWTALNCEVLRADEGEVMRVWRSDGMKGWGKREIPGENPPNSDIVRPDSHLRKSSVNRPGIEPVSPWLEAISRRSIRFSDESTSAAEVRAVYAPPQTITSASTDKPRSQIMTQDTRLESTYVGYVNSTAKHMTPCPLNWEWFSPSDVQFPIQVGSQDLAVKSRQNLFSHIHSPNPARLGVQGIFQVKANEFFKPLRPPSARFTRVGSLGDCAALSGEREEPRGGAGSEQREENLRLRASVQRSDASDASVYQYVVTSSNDNGRPTEISSTGVVGDIAEKAYLENKPLVSRSTCERRQEQMQSETQEGANVFPNYNDTNRKVAHVCHNSGSIIIHKPVLVHFRWAPIVRRTVNRMINGTYPQLRKDPTHTHKIKKCKSSITDMYTRVNASNDLGALGECTLGDLALFKCRRKGLAQSVGVGPRPAIARLHSAVPVDDRRVPSPTSSDVTLTQDEHSLQLPCLRASLQNLTPGRTLQGHEMTAQQAAAAALCRDVRESLSGSHQRCCCLDDIPGNCREGDSYMR